MMYKTHLTIGIFLALLFLPVVKYKVIFCSIVVASTFLPDIDCTQSYIGRYRILRPLQWFVKHRTIFHSFSLALIVSIVLSFYYPIFALPFFLGYSGHLIADALTPEGIRPFWPSKDEIKWKIKTDGKIEKILFYCLIFGNILLLARIFV